MLNPSDVPYGNKAQGRCPNCTRDSGFQLVDRTTLWPTWIGHGQTLPENYPRADLTIWRCLYCDKTTTAVVYWPDETAHAEIIYAWPKPAPRELPESVLEPIRGLFREASLAANVGARRAAAGAYRAAAEAIVSDKKATGGDLKARINALRKMGVDADLVDSLHEARLLGNWSLHEGVDFSDEEVEDVAELIADACHELYEEPARREEMRAAREAKRRRDNSTTSAT
jgi:hypothetical protein